LVKLFQKLAQWRLRKPPRPPQRAKSPIRRFFLLTQIRVAICNERIARISFHLRLLLAKKKWLRNLYDFKNCMPLSAACVLEPISPVSLSPLGQEKERTETVGMNKKTVMITAGAIGGAIALGAGAWALWNSRQLRMARAARRVGQILYKAGAVLQSVSEIAQ